MMKALGIRSWDRESLLRACSLVLTPLLAQHAARTCD